MFLRDHVGGTTNVPMTNTSHTCADGSLSGYTHVVDFPGTPDQPRGFTVHFVYNPRQMTLSGAHTYVVNGRIGTEGTLQTPVFHGDAAAARKFFDKTVKSKLKKGYQPA